MTERTSRKDVLNSNLVQANSPILTFLMLGIIVVTLLFWAYLIDRPGDTSACTGIQKVVVQLGETVDGIIVRDVEGLNHVDRRDLASQVLADSGYPQTRTLQPGDVLELPTKCS